MNIERQLEKAGLTHSEISIYLYLLEHGLATPSQIGKGTEVARTNTYHVLKSLKNDGLIMQQKKGSKTVYLANDPSALIREMDKKRSAIADVLPDLRALHNTQKNKPKVRFYVGWDQVQLIYKESLRSEEVFAIGSIKRLESIDSTFFKKYVNDIKNNKVIYHDIITKESSEGAEEVKLILKGLHSCTFLPNNTEGLDTDMLVWDDSVALITLEEPIFGTLLVNQAMASSFRTLFRVLESKL